MGVISLTIVSVCTGVLGGGIGGFWAGARVRGRQRAYWLLNLVALVGGAMIDLMALATGRQLLAYAAIGLMGGAITGLKYGYTDSLREWPQPMPELSPEGDAAKASLEPVSESASDDGDSLR